LAKADFLRASCGSRTATWLSVAVRFQSNPEGRNLGNDAYDPKQPSPTRPRCDAAIASAVCLSSDTLVAWAQIGGGRVRRRDFIIQLGGAAVAWPRSPIAQSTNRKRRIGVLWGLAATDPLWLERFGAFSQSLQDLGWSEGMNVSFEIRHAVEEPDQPSAQAASLVAANVDVIVVTSAGLADVCRKVTSTIPIVVVAAGDLESAGLVASLRRPGGNVTGLQALSPELMNKRLELLKQLVPNLTRVGVILSPRLRALHPATSRSSTTRLMCWEFGFTGSRSAVRKSSPPPLRQWREMVIRPRWRSPIPFRTHTATT
jgi:hypothetical protein